MTDSRDKILRAAGPIFAEKGYKSATVREICQIAAVNVAAVNYYFGDKQSLYIETVKHATRSLADKVPLPEWPPGTGPEIRLRGMIRTLLTRMLSNAAPWEQQLMMREVLHPTAACRAMAEEYFRPHFELLLEIIDPLLPPDTPDPKRHQIGFSIVGQCVHYRLAGAVVEMLTPASERPHFQIDQLAEHIAGFSLAAIAAGCQMAESANKSTGAFAPSLRDGG
jgi:AcrR family transcriptional regulator